MATLFSLLLLPTNETDAFFRTWIQFIHDTLVLGWVQTGDTGQLNIATASKPTAANQKVGYLVYRMDDALQATAPVFMRLDFGSAGFGANYAGVWITIGTGSDGAGTITTIRYNGGASAASQVQISGIVNSGVHNSYGSAASNRFSFGMFITTNSSRIMLFTLERSKDVNGADTSEGVFLTYGQGTYLRYNNFIVLGSATQPPQEVGLAYILSNQNPSIFRNDGALGLVFPMRGGVQPAGKNIAIVRQNDMQAEAQFSAFLYGESIVFQHMNIAQCYHIAATSSDGSARVCLRFD
jgi:hypothetical protein